MNKRKICVVTGTRAEYGLLYWLMKEIQSDPDLELQIIATGMHLSPEFGLTYKQIEEDGFVINEKVEMLLSSDTPVGIAKSLGLGTIGFADSLNRLKPDILVLLGDRFEILAAAQAAMIARIPIAHIHGGELTEGLIDDPIRHSITKMSHIHFTAAEEYRKRVIQMGEQPERVFNFGAPGIDNIFKLNLPSKEQLKKDLQIDFDQKVFLITYHPTTLEEGTTKQQIEELLSALDSFPEVQLLFTKSNADTEGRVINQLFEEYVKKNKHRAKIYTTLGQARYLASLKYCSLVIGNSSSGLIEAPLFKVPTINIGDRQRGRLKAKSVIDCSPSKDDIIRAIKLSQSRDFQNSLKEVTSLYGIGDTAVKIKEKLKEIDLTNILKKTFFHVDVEV
jgi:UDP-hydrolysing UDP-N-acetyl-D-glucosamine 2-epimerase